MTQFTHNPLQSRVQSWWRTLKRMAGIAVLTGSTLAGATDFDLSLTKTASATTITAGSTVTFTLNVKNVGPYAATNVVIQDALPKGFAFVGSTPTRDSVDSTSDPKVVKSYFNLGSISAGASKTITIQATGVASSSLTSPTIGGTYDYTNVAQVYSVDYSTYDPDSRPNNCNYSTIIAGSSMEDDCAKVLVSVSGSVTPPPTPPVSGTCTATTPYVQSFNSNATLAEVVSPYVYNSDPNVVTSTDGTYTLWSGIDHTGNSGYALYMNIANYAGNNGSDLVTPALLYQSTINVPSGATINYQNWLRSHGTTNTQLRYVFSDTATGTVLKSYDGAVASTSYTLESVPSFTATGSQVTLRIYTLKDGTSADLNVLKLDDLKLSCAVPTKPSLTITKASNSSTWTVGQSGASYTLTVKNSGTATTSGTVTVKDLLPTGITASSSSFTTNGWSCSVSSQVVTCTGTPNLAAGASSTLSFGVNVTDSAASSVTNKASVGGGGDPDLQPDPSTCTTTAGQCATATTTINPQTPPPPTPGTCTATAPYVQSFNTGGPLGEVKNHIYKSDPNVVTSTDGTYTLWSGIDHTGNSGYALYLNIANFEGKNGGTLTTPGLLYESVINVPVGSTVSYENWVRSHSDTATQVRYVISDTATGTVLKTYDGAVATTSYTLQTVPSFTATGSQITVRLYTLKDGTSADTNVLKLDDIKITCPTPAPPSLTITKSSNGPWTVGQSGASYTLTVKNDGASPTSGTITVKDLLPTGVTSTLSSFSPASGWTCSASGQLVTCTSSNVLAAGASVNLPFNVNVADAAIGTITNKASVGGGGDPDPQPDPSTCTTTGGQCATNTTTVTTATPVTCTNLYGLTINSGGSSTDGVTIRLIGDTTNAVGNVIATLPNSGTSATLAISPDGKKFFTAVDNDRLRVYDTTTGTWAAGYTFSSATNRIVRMTIAPDGTGYAMDSDANFWSFQTTTPYATTYLGKVTSSSSGAPSFYENGDFFATADGKLYMISAVTGSTNIDLWLITPSSTVGGTTAEYLGRLSNPAESSQFNGLAATPNGVFARDNLGRLVKIDLLNLTYTMVGSSTLGSTDLASCYFPSYAPKLDVVKSVKKVAGSSGDKVQPGDTLEYTIVVRNSGTLPAGGVTFRDALPAGTTYVADSARVNGATTTVTGGTATNLAGATYPFSNPVGICSNSLAPCTTQVLKIDSTAGVIDNEAVITFRVKVNDPFTLTPSQVVNQASVNYTGGPGGGVPSNQVVTPVYQPAKLEVVKTVQNITRNGPVGTEASGTPGDVLEYCIATTNVGGLNATNIQFGDNVASTTNFQVGAYGTGQDIKVTTVSGTVYYTAAADGDPGALVNSRVTVNGGTFVLLPGQTVTICFRTTIK